MELTKTALMDETKVHYGIARAHQLMLTMKSYIESADIDSLNCLLSWKESRTQIQYDPVLGKALAFRFCIILSSQGISVGNVYSHVTDLNLLGNFVLVLRLLRWKLGALSLLAVFKRSIRRGSDVSADHSPLSDRHFPVTFEATLCTDGL